MKKFFLMALTTMILISPNINAQSNNRESRRAEMQARQAERLMKDLELSDEQKAKFEPIYSNYQKELVATYQNAARNNDSAGETKKDLTDAEATAQLQEVFTRQAAQIQQSQLRLDIQKKYCAELSGVLTPQQLLKVFSPRQNRTRQGANAYRQGGRNYQGGGFGGGGNFGGGGF